RLPFSLISLLSLHAALPICNGFRAAATSQPAAEYPLHRDTFASKLLAVMPMRRANALAADWSLHSVCKQKHTSTLLLLQRLQATDRKSTRLNSSHVSISYAV